MEQRVEEWYQARLGKVTASRVADVMAKTKTGVSASRANYQAELLCELLTGNPQTIKPTAAMMRGVELEDEAKAVYVMETGNTVTDTGFIEHPTISGSGASPDGLVGECGLVEIKCPNTATHIAFLQSGKPDKKYIYQMQWQMACTMRDWCDFVSYDDRMPEKLAIKIVRINRDNDLIGEMEKEVSDFINKLNSLHKKLLKIETA